MLTFLFALAGLWTLFWFVMLTIDWGERTSFTDSKGLCTTCANALEPGAVSAKLSATNIISPKPTSDTIIRKPVADQHDQVNVKPLFTTNDEQDDLKKIKGIGVVMERTLNELGISTFKQLAGFQQAEVMMVSDVLSESKAGFGDRIERDEWVDQAKGLVKKAS